MLPIFSKSFLKRQQNIHSNEMKVYEVTAGGFRYGIDPGLVLSNSYTQVLNLKQVWQSFPGLCRCLQPPYRKVCQTMIHCTPDCSLEGQARRLCASSKFSSSAILSRCADYVAWSSLCFGKLQSAWSFCIPDSHPLAIGGPRWAG